jgi:1-deoxy-D-xylulose-5-phosphate reductoisomerase
MARAGLAGAVFNAAKETALDGFISGHLKFTQMSDVVAQTLEQMDATGGHIDATMTLDNVLETDNVAREAARNIIEKRAR